MKVLVTGANGFVGAHLVRQLLASQHEVIACVYRHAAAPQAGVTAVELDLTDAQAIDGVVASHQPQWVFHLAALSSPAASFTDNNATLLKNIEIQANLLNALVLHAPQARVLVVSSAEVYGKVDESNLPIDEQCPLRPVSPYGVSKIAQDYMGLQYYLSKKLDVVRVRPFNHIGEGQLNHFVLPAFAEQIARIEAGKQEPRIKVGNLSATRDFTDVLDMVKAYELALLKGEPGEVYNLGSGTEVSIQDVLHQLLELSSVPIEVVPDPARMIPADVPRLRAECGKFKQLTGWSPVIPLTQTIRRVLDYWRQAVETKI